MPENKYLFVKNGSVFTRVYLTTILWMEAKGRKVYIHTDEGVVISNSSIKKVDVSLAGTSMLRIHKSFMINTEKLVTVRNGHVHIQNKSIKIGRTYIKDVKERLSDLQL